MPSPIKPTTIEEYIFSSPPQLQERLWELHELIRKSAPGAAESVKWGMPAYSMDKILVTYKAFKKHIGFYPMESAIKAFRKELAGYKTASGSVQLPHDKPLPKLLIKNIIKFRVKENKEGTIKWRS